MNAEFDPEHLSSLFDGELTPSESDRVRRQIENAPEQQALLEEFAQIRSLLRELPRESAPEGIAEAVRSQIEKSKPQPADVKISRNRNWRWMVSSLAACGLLVLGMFYYAPGMQSQMETDNKLLVAESTPMMEGDLETGLGMSRENSADTELAKPSNDLVSTFSAPPESGYADVSALPEQEDGNFHTHAAPMMRKADHIQDVFPMTPSAPPLEFRDESELQLARLAASPKWQNKLQPGELVQYITVADDEVAVVELSVVDVAFFYGEMQVLLAAQQIPPLKRLNDRAESNGHRLPFSQQTDNERADQPKRKPTEKEVLSQLPQMDKNGLLAVYVEASGTQVLRSLEALASMEQLQGLSLGTVKRDADAFSVVAFEPADSEAEFGTADETTVASERNSFSFLLEPAAPRGNLPRWQYLPTEDSLAATVADSAAADSAMSNDADSSYQGSPQIFSAGAPEMSATMNSGAPGVGIAGENMEPQAMTFTTDEQPPAEPEISTAYQLPARVQPIDRSGRQGPARAAKSPADATQASPFDAEIGVAATESSAESGEQKQETEVAPTSVSCRVLFVLAPLQPAAEPANK